MRRCALLLLIALALALLAVGAQAQERGDAAGEPPAAPRMTRLSWSGLTIRAEWDSVARATGYDLRWTLEGQRLAVGGERAARSSPAEFSVPRAGRWRVEVRARIGSGPSAVRGEWSRPLTMRLYDPPPRLEVERFDGEYARLNWTGVGAHYELEWGERGGAKRLVRRDGRSPTLELGPLEGGKTYEFRVRARNNGGRSGYSPTAVFTPTGWRGGRPGAGYVGRIGQIYALWFPQRGAEWYELSWINAADPTETARVRVGTATSGGSRPQVPGQIGREGGFENGTWNVRVRAGPRGVWSPLYPLTLSNQPERLTLVLVRWQGDCREFRRIELVWFISGGVPPYTRTLDGQAIDADAASAIVTCSPPADTDPPPGLEQAFKGGVTDSRGVTAEDELRAALTWPPPRTAPGTVLHGASDDAALRLSWTAVSAVPSVSAYELQYQATAWDATSWPDSWTTINDTIAGSATEYLHRNLDSNRRYRYQLRARNGVDAGEWSRAFPEVGLRPGAPLLEARTAVSGSVALSWSAGPAGATRWEYRRRQGGGSWGAWTAVVGSDASTAEHAVAGLTEDARYQFQLRARTANGASPASAIVSAVAGLTPTAPSERESLFYDDLDSASGATRPGSYAFLKSANDLTSGATTFAEVSTAEALLLNTSGYGGRDYAEVLSTVLVGDRITWSPYSRCWYHYRVTEILTNPPPPVRKLLRITLHSEDPCGAAAAQAGTAKSEFDESRSNVTAFDWDPPPNEPRVGADGIRILPGWYPAVGGHTYRLHEQGPIVVDVPAGMRLLSGSFALQSDGTGYATYFDDASGFVMGLDPHTGEYAAYRVETPEGEAEPTADMIARFDALMDSIREVPLP